MPLRTTPFHLNRLAATLALAAAALLVPAAAASAACVELPVTKAFKKFGDTADYSPAPGGTFEGASGWTLKNGATIVGGNENAGVASGTRSLSLGPKAYAISPEFCVSEQNPYFRFMKKTNFWYSTFSALVLYRDAQGTPTKAQFVASSNKDIFPGLWKPSTVNPLAVKIPLLSGGKTASVQIMLQANLGITQIDSVMVDPYRRG